MNIAELAKTVYFYWFDQTRREEVGRDRFPGWSRLSKIILQRWPPSRSSIIGRDGGRRNHSYFDRETSFISRFL